MRWAIGIRERSPREWLSWLLQSIASGLSQNWGTKITALLLALVVFLVTRDEVQRTFTLPIRVVQDPDRVLLTELPSTVAVDVRGPWTRVNKLHTNALGSAVLDLREARPGPLEIDPAGIVMPAGVVLDGMDYDRVDLRFDPVIERDLEVKPRITGDVAADHELMRVELDPPRWTIRGASEVVGAVAELETEPIEVTDAMADMEVSVAVLRPVDGVHFLGVLEADQPKVRVKISVKPIPGELLQSVAVEPAIRATFPKRPELAAPAIERIRIRGPRPLLREVEGMSQAVKPAVEVLENARNKPPRVEIRFEWSVAVSEAAREALVIEPAVVRLTLVDEPPPEEAAEQAADEQPEGEP